MSATVPVIIPQDNVNDESVTLLSWSASNGEHVVEGQVIAEIETSKAVMEIEAPAAGVLEYSFEPGTDVGVGATLCTIRGEREGAVEHVASSEPSREVSAPVNGESSPLVAQKEAPHASPAHFTNRAQTLLVERGLSPERFAGRGIIRAEDILVELGERSAPSRRASLPSPQPKPIAASLGAPVAAARVPFRSEKLSKSKRTEIGYLSSGYHHTLSSVVTVAAPTRGLKAAVEQHEAVQASTTAIIVFEVARLLRRYPHFNAFYQDDHVYVYDEINIGFAIDADHGLKVPVIRRADTKSLADISQEMQELIVAYLENTLSSEQLQGGTCTITDLSTEGVMTFHPLLNQGQSAILGVGAEFFPPGSRDGVFHLILAFDHQVSEGRAAAQFLNELRDHLCAYESALQGSSSTQTNGVDVQNVACARCLTPLAQIQEWDKFEHWDHFMVKTVKPNGQHAYLCSVCMRGW